MPSIKSHRHPELRVARHLNIPRGRHPGRPQHPLFFTPRRCNTVRNHLESTTVQPSLSTPGAVRVSPDSRHNERPAVAPSDGFSRSFFHSCHKHRIDQTVPGRGRHESVSFSANLLRSRAGQPLASRSKPLHRSGRYTDRHAPTQACLANPASRSEPVLTEYASCRSSFYLLTSSIIGINMFLIHKYYFFTAIIIQATLSMILGGDRTGCS